MANKRILEVLTKSKNGQWSLHKTEAIKQTNPAIGQQENKITLNHDPNDFGAHINGDFNHIKETSAPVHSISGFEPEDKMTRPESQQKIKSMTQDISSGQKMPPVLVRQHNNGFQVLDGHHRFHAMKQSGLGAIPIKIVPSESISEINKPKI